MDALTSMSTVARLQRRLMAANTLSKFACPRGIGTAVGVIQKAAASGCGVY